MSRNEKRFRTNPWTVGGVLLRVLVGILLFYLLAPIFIVFPMSLSPGRYMVFPPTGVSFQWFQTYFSSDAWISASLLSIQVALLSTAIATTLGTLAAFAIVRSRFPGKELLYAFILSPWIVPPIIMAISLFFVVVRLGLIGNAFVLASAHAVLGIPAVVVVVSATLKGFDLSFEHASMSLGANRWQTFRHVTFPLIRPGVLTGALFAFLASFDDLILALYLGGERAVTLPRRLWSGLRFEINPTIAAVSVILILLTVLMLVLIEISRRRAEWLTGSKS